MLHVCMCMCVRSEVFFSLFSRPRHRCSYQITQTLILPVSSLVFVPSVRPTSFIFIICNCCEVCTCACACLAAKVKKHRVRVCVCVSLYVCSRKLLCRCFCAVFALVRVVDSLLLNTLSSQHQRAPNATLTLGFCCYCKCVYVLLICLPLLLCYIAFSPSQTPV